MSAFRSLPIAGSATLTTVPSRNAIPDPNAVAAKTHRPRAVPSAIRSSLIGSAWQIELEHDEGPGGRDAGPDREVGRIAGRAPPLGHQRADRVQQSARHRDV